jgi:hypothetical protein
MRDYFGQDDLQSDGAPVPPPTLPAATPTVAPGTTAPTLQQSVDKAVAKAGADAVVATDPHAVHSVKLAATAPPVLGATAAGAGVGFMVGGPPGAAVGAAAGWVMERYQIGGGPVRKIWVHIKKHLHKNAAAAPAAAAAAPAAAAPPPAAQ